MTTPCKPSFSLTATAISTGTIMSAAMLLAQPAQATIVTIATGGQTTLAGETSFDVNSDGARDLVFRHVWRERSNGLSVKHDLYAEGANGAQVKTGRWLVAGNMIDGTVSFADSNHLVDYSYTAGGKVCDKYGCFNGTTSIEHNGTWANYGYTVHGYLGFQLSNGTDDYFGWVDMYVPSDGYANIVSIAYENCANVGIAAGQTVSSCAQTPDNVSTDLPEPSPLALLAIGAAGVAVMRRRRVRKA